MKPEQGSTEVSDMDESDKDPRELLQELVLEVLEARTPDPGTKGRIEGPHCPQSKSGQTHVCSADRLECQRLCSLERQLDLLWRNQIPACMDVLLYPDCPHGQREARVLEVTGQAGADQWTDNCILLERWTFKFCQKRHMEKSGYRSVGPVMLLQAVKSYLHFSQLSSWLLSSGGCLPLTVVYRLYAPGENVSYDFQEIPDQHKFPKGDLVHYGVKVSVSSLPRREMVFIKCKQGQTTTKSSSVPPCSRKTSTKGQDENEKLGEEPAQTERGRSLKRTRHHQSEISRKRENRRYPQGFPGDRDKHSTNNHTVISHYSSSTSTNLDKRQSLDENSFKQYRDPNRTPKCPLFAKSTQRNRQQDGSQTATDLTPSTHNKHSGIQPEQSDFRESYPQKFRVESPSRFAFTEKPLPLKSDMSSTSQLKVSTMAATSLCLHSPKVLMTSHTKPDQVFKKKCLDLSTSSDSDEWDNPYVSMKIKDLASPLSPTDIQTYLASLQQVAYTQTNHSTGSTDLCVTPKCKFYLGSEWDVSSDQNTEKNKSKGDNSFANSGISDISNTDLKTSPAKLSQDDLDSVTKKLHELSPFRHSESPPSKKEKRENVSKYSESKNSIQSRNLDSSETPLSVSKTSKRKLSEDHTTETGAKCSSLDDSGLVTSGVTSSNGHTDNTIKNGVSTTQRSPDRCRSPQNGASVSQSEESLCNNCDKPINVRLSYLRKFPTTPTLEDTTTFQRHMTKSASMMFSSRTGLPTQSSPAPIKRKSLGRFEYDSALTSARAIKNAISCSKLVLGCTKDNKDESEETTGRVLSTSAPASTNCLLGNFEESMLNGRIEPIGAVDGFTAEIGASGSFCPKHITLPVTAYFFKLSDDNAPSPYLGHINMESLGKRGYHIPSRGTVQVTLFNPNKTVVKMFVVMYDLSDMPANCQTFLRQRTLYMPVDQNSEEPSYLRYLIHLRFATSKSRKVHLHTDIRLIFARDKFEFDPKVAQYELRSFNEGPINPKFSPKR